MRLAARAAGSLAVAVAMATAVPGRASADACAWSSTSPPSPGTASSTLTDVDASSAGDVWAVGWRADSADPDLHLPLSIHWDGTAWTEVSMPALEGLSTELAGVAAIADGDAWAVGTTRNPATLRDRFVMYRWNAGEWHIARRGAEEGARSTLHGISASATDDIWAVGFINDRTLTVHWDGEHWSRVPSPNPGRRFNGLFGVAAIDAGRAWAVGDRRDQGDGSPLILRWNGTAWGVAAAPVPKPVAGLRSVDGGARADVWAVGFAGAKTLVLRFEGAGWHKVRSPNPGANGNDLDAVSAGPNDDAWAAGRRLDEQDPSRNLILHFDGAAWKVEASAPDPGAGNRLAGIAAAGSEVWAVGETRLSDVPSTQALLGCGSGQPTGSIP